MLCHNANEYQADTQARDNETFELKELIFKLCVEVDELREDAKKVKVTSEKESVEACDYQEQMTVLLQRLADSRQQLEVQGQKTQEGERRLSRLQEEVRVNQLQPKPERQEGLSDDVRAAIEDRFVKIEEKLQRNRQQSSWWQEDSVRDPSTPKMTRLSVAARKGDLRAEVESPDVCRVGEVVLLGEQEAKMVVDKGSLVFRFPIERDYPEGTVIRPLSENEFIQSEGDRLCVYRRGPDDDIHYVCRVDLLERVTPERGGEFDEAQEHAYEEDLEARIQRIIEAREAAQSRNGGVSGVMVPPLSSAHECTQPFRARAVDLPSFGQGTNGQSRGEEVQGAEQGRSAYQGGAQEANAASNVRVKQEEDLQSPLDEYFCKGMDTSGPAAWAKVLHDMTTKDLPEVGYLMLGKEFEKKNGYLLIFGRSSFLPLRLLR